MHILHIIQRYWPARGGAEIHLGEISRRLAADGHAVTVATSDALDFELFWDRSRRRIKETEGIHDSVRILRFPVQHLPVSKVAYPGMQRLLWILSKTEIVPTTLMQRFAHFIPWMPALSRWLRTTDTPFDLVASMTICFDALMAAGLRFAQQRKLPFVTYPLTHLGAGEAPGQDKLSRFYTLRHQTALVRASDAVIAQTSTEEAYYAERGVPKERILVAGPGINPEEVLGGQAERFLAKHQIRAPLILSLSSMSYDKGTMHLVEAVRQLWETGETVELALAGAILAPFRHYFEGLPQPVQKRIHLLGPVSEEDKRDMLAAADIVALPSRTDSFGIVYMEGWLYGKPVVGANTWGVNDVIEDGQDGVLVPFGDVPALAQALADLIHDPEKREQMGERGRAKVLRHHTWDTKYPTIHQVYQRLVSTGAAGHLSDV